MNSGKFFDNPSILSAVFSLTFHRSSARLHHLPEGGFADRYHILGPDRLLLSLLLCLVLPRFCMTSRRAPL